MTQSPRRTQRHFQYLIFISIVGTILLGWSIFHFVGFERKIYFFLFVLLGAMAQVAATTATIKSKTGITYALSPSVSLGAVPFYGPAAAVIIESVTSLSLWLLKPADEINWKRSWAQLAFNAGMSQISILGGSYVYLLMVELLGTNNLLGLIIPWLFAAAVNDQLNLWMLTIMLRLQHGKEFHILTIWKENAWAIPIGILTTSVGGGFLAFSFGQLGWVGIAIFFLPLVLSAYAFRLYVSQMQAHMDNLENIVAERTDALKRALQEKDAFLAVLSHDMKTPLTTIRLYVKMLKDRPHVLAQKPQVIDTVLHSQEVLTDIVNNILDLEKLQAEGELPLKKETFDYVSLAQRVVTLIQVQAESKHIDLQLKGFEQNLPVYADLSYMERVLNNLLSNAIKYTPEEGNIEVKLSAQENELAVVVQDSGYGIPSEDLPYVFDRFRRVASHQKLAAGTGLGLAITKALVEAHEGRIEVTSQIEEGSCFIAYLPILAQPETIPKKQGDKGTTPFISY